MHFNSAELEYLAISNRNFDFSDVFFVAEQSNFDKVKHKGHLCRIFQNLLFIFKGQEVSSGVQYVIFLHGIQVSTDSDSGNSILYLYFHKGNDKTLAFQHKNSEQIEKFKTVLLKADYEHALEEYEQFKQLKIETSNAKILKRHLQMNYRVDFFVTLISTDNIERWISLKMLIPGIHKEWLFQSRTESLSGCNRQFRTVLNLPNINEAPFDVLLQTRLRFSVNPITAVDHPCKMCTLNEVRSDIEFQLQNSNQIRFKLTIKPSTTIPLPEVPEFLKTNSISNRDSLFFRDLNQSKYALDAHSKDTAFLFGSVDHQAYRFVREIPEPLLVFEYLAESLLTISIPLQILKHCKSLILDAIRHLNHYPCLNARVRKAFHKSLGVMHLELVRNLKSVLQLSSSSTPSFKASTRRNEPGIDFLPINLHMHRMRVVEMGTDDTVYEVITGGAPTAHRLGYQYGGLLRHATPRNLNELNEMQKHVASLNNLESSAEDAQSAISEKPMNGIKFKEFLQAIKDRKDEFKEMVINAADATPDRNSFSAPIALVRVSSLQDINETDLEAMLEKGANAQNAIDANQSLTQLKKVIGPELGMLEDTIYVCDWLHNNLRFRIVPLDGDADGTPLVEFCESVLVVSLPVPNEVFSVLPCTLQAGKHIRCHISLINTPVNEVSYLVSSQVGNHSNQRSLERLKEWVELAWSSSSQSHWAAIDRLSKEVNTSKTGPHLALVEAIEDAGWILGAAARITSCKSAKDRTSMAVTHEMTRILIKNHQLIKNDDNIHRTRDVFRETGTRLRNVFKNTGRPKYAFNMIQVASLPEEFKPPSGTYGGGPT